MAGDISPVNAPFSSGYTFCAPQWTEVRARKKFVSGRSVNGGQMSISTPSFFCSLKCLKKASASSTVQFIFQFPAIRICLTGITPYPPG